MLDVLDLQPHPDDDTAHIVDQALIALARARGLHPHSHAIVLHLLVSIHQQLQAEILTATLAAHQHGHSPGELAVLLDHA